MGEVKQMDAYSRSIEDNINPSNLNFINNNCKYCLFIKDTISELITIEIGRTRYLHCNNCDRNCCDFCFNNVYRISSNCE